MMLPESSKEITSSSFENEQPCRHFTFDEIKAATGNFRPDLKLGEGGFGNVFKGNLSNEAVSIIRTFISKSGRNFLELLVEIERLANFQHPNVVRFIGGSDDDTGLEL
nr:receptor-like protein kinase FERONIA [Tanacetum cinerariifolium]